MSYILDALRRAEAERQRGQVPGLDAQPVARPADSDAPRRLPLGSLVAGAVLLAAGITAAVWWRTQPTVAPAAAPAMTPPATQVTPPPAAPPTDKLPVVVSAPPTPAPTPPGRVILPASAPAPPIAATAASAHEPAPARSEPKSTPLAALSADLRRELPPLAIGGSIWSDSAAQRFVIINGQVVHEGEVVAAGVVLERIGPKAAVLRWRDLRIELPL